MRDNDWLGKQLELLLKKYFANAKITNPIEIKFGREAKYRFGSIRLLKPKAFRHWPLAIGKKRAKSEKPQKSIITITSIFRKPTIPVAVVHYTIAHELCHYVHGFSSANRRLFKFPHHGGVVNQELKERGAEELVMAFKKWLKEYRKKILATNH